MFSATPSAACPPPASIRDGRHRPPGASELLLRQLAMLQMLPPFPRYIGTREIHERLVASGFKVTFRTIQRDLLALQPSFAIECDTTTRPYGWRWARGAPEPKVPSVSAAPAIELVALTTPSVADELPGALAVPLADGRVRVEASVTDGESLRRWVLGLGEGIEVLEPAALREEIRSIALRVAGNHGER